MLPHTAQGGSHAWAGLFKVQIGFFAFRPFREMRGTRPRGRPVSRWGTLSSVHTQIEFAFSTHVSIEDDGDFGCTLYPVLGMGTRSPASYDLEMRRLKL